MAKGALHRLASGFVTLWIWLFAPSFVGWGIAVRFFGGGSDAFHSLWIWMEDKLVYPRLFSPLAAKAWTWFEEGSSLTAFMGFVILVALWSAVLVIPPLLITFWWRVAAGRLGGASASGHYTTTSSSFAQHPLAPLYLITLPLGMLWNGFLAVTRFFHREGSGTVPSSTSGNAHPVLRFLWPIVTVFIIIVLLQLAYFQFYFHYQTAATWIKPYRTLAMDDWFGYLDTLHVPRLLDRQYQFNRGVVLALYAPDHPQGLQAHLNEGLSNPYLRGLATVIALRQAMLVAAVVAVIQLFRKAL